MKSQINNFKMQLLIPETINVNTKNAIKFLYLNNLI